MTIPLDPCPFCGDEAEIERLGSPRQSTIYVCTVCGCMLETAEEWDHGRQWNNRATYDKQTQRVVDYLKRVAPDVGAGDDPIGFLITSHEFLANQLKEKKNG